MATIPLDPILLDGIRQRRPFKSAHQIGYVTRGGTYIIATRAKWNDDDRPHDVVAILPADWGAGRVYVLRPTVNPDWARALELALARAEGAGS